MRLGAPGSARSSTRMWQGTGSSAARACRRSARRATRTSGLPRTAYWRAMAAPMPLEAPVIRAWPVSEGRDMRAPRGKGPGRYGREGEPRTRRFRTRGVSFAAFAVRTAKDLDMRPKIVAGNWKLNGSRAFARELLDAVVAGERPAGVELVILPPVPYLAELADRYAGQGLAFGAQDLDLHEQGAYTGEVAGAMLRDVGARYVLVGHSGRREYHEEGSRLVAEKFGLAQKAGLVPILCVGETLHQREAGQTEWAIEKQLAPVVELA